MITAIKVATAAMLILVLAPCATAHADDGPERGWFSPSFQDSPVNLILCTTKDACKF